jgi:hypothetical protein
MYSVMIRLINKRLYATAAEAQDKLDVFFAVGRLTDEQYTELALLAEEVYGNE